MGCSELVQKSLYYCRRLSLCFDSSCCIFLNGVAKMMKMLNIYFRIIAEVSGSQSNSFIYSLFIFMQTRFCRCLAEEVEEAHSNSHYFLRVFNIALF